MTRSELIQRLVEQGIGLSIQQTEKSVGVILHEITDALAQGKRVELRGFGIFTVRHRQGRVARNPRTGEKLKVAPKSVPFFKAGKELRNRLNQA
jgi:integration host factor subunit beta